MEPWSVGRVELAAAQQRDAHRLEVVVHRAAEFDFRPFARRQAASLDADLRRHVRAAERQPCRSAGRGHARQRVEAREQRGIERAALIGGLVAAGQRNLQREQVVGAEARIDREHRQEAAEQQARTQREHDCETRPRRRPARCAGGAGRGRRSSRVPTTSAWTAVPASTPPAPARCRWPGRSAAKWRT